MLIFHGDNIVKSRKDLINLIKSAKEKGKEIIRLNGQEIDQTAVIQALETQSLFGNEKFIVIENLIARKDQEAKKVIDYLAKHDHDENIIWWEGRQVTPGTLKKFSKAKAINLKISPQIFKFLDSLSPGYPKQPLVLFKACLQQDGAEMVFYMLARQVRLLIQAKDKKADQLLKMAPWQKGKLKRQAEKFTLKQLFSLHQELTKIDYQQKVGLDPYKLSSRLDLLIANM